MTRQRIYLPGWVWLVIVFYWTDREDADEILQVLQGFGCSSRTLTDAGENLEEGSEDSGLTYTNADRRCTVMVISRCSSPAQFCNTLAHEQGHACRHMAEALGLDPDGEPVQYLAGDLAERMYPYAREYLA